MLDERKDATATTFGGGACGGGGEILRHDLTAEEGGAAHEMGMNGEGILVNSQLSHFFQTCQKRQQKKDRGGVLLKQSTLSFPHPSKISSWTGFI
jgi:hypothetical protein